MPSTSRTPGLVSPKVRLLAKTLIVDEELLDDIMSNSHPCYEMDSFNDGQALIEFAGRQCYESFDNPSGRTNYEYVCNIKAQKHWSVLEHVHITFRLTGVPRYLTHELIRHRHFNYSELSQRYVDRSEAPFIASECVANDPDIMRIFLDAMGTAQNYYKLLTAMVQKRYPTLKTKEVRDAVRGCLPESIETRIVVTGNLRSWLDFMLKRYHEAADEKIREIAGLVLEQLRYEYPAVYDDVVLLK